MIREWYPLTSNLPREISPLPDPEAENGLRHNRTSGKERVLQNKLTTKRSNLK